MIARLATISVVRNEADIIETFVRHHCALGATMHFVLHRCIDNTGEILEKLRSEGLPVTVQTSEDAAHLQGERVTEIAQRIVREKSADWILPLDADEFLTSGDRRDIGTCLRGLAQDRIILVQWKTYVPTPDDDITESCPVRRIVHRRTMEMPVFHKVLVPVASLKTTLWKIPTGSHVVLDLQSQNTYPTIISAELSLAHFPVRSSEQLCAKNLAGWIAVVATPDREPERCYHWKGLVERCMDGRPLSLGELRNVALRYATPEGSHLPTFTRDPIVTAAMRPLYAIHTASALAATFDAGLACAEIVGECVQKEKSENALEGAALELQAHTENLAKVLTEQRDVYLMPDNDNANAVVCITAMISGTLLAGGTLTGSALSRRQQLATHLPALPLQWQWIPMIFSADKLPHRLERALQEIVSTITSMDIAALRHICRTNIASDDVLLGLIQCMTRGERATIPLPLALCIAQSLHHLLQHEAGVENGLSNARVRMMDPACARGEIACELLRRSAHALLEQGTNMEMLRKTLLAQFDLRDHSPELLGMTCVRMATTLANMHMPLQHDENLPMTSNRMSQDSLPPDGTSIPVIGTGIVTGSNAFAPQEETVSLLNTYVRKLRLAGTDCDTEHSPVLQSIAHVHAVLRSAEISAGGIIIPRSILHEGRYATLRAMLLEDFEQLWILDLGGAQPSSADEPIDGSDTSGSAILFLVRTPGATQGAHYVSWKGLRIQKYHALLSRGFGELPWNRIAPQKPGYVFLA